MTYLRRRDGGAGTPFCGSCFSLATTCGSTPRILAEAELAWGNLLGATVGLSDDDLDVVSPDSGWPIRHILEHVRESERVYLEAIRTARAQQTGMD